MRQGFGDGRMSSLPWSNSRQGLDRARLGPPFLVHRPLDDVDAHCDGRCLALCDLRCRDHSHSYSSSLHVPLPRGASQRNVFRTGRQRLAGLKCSSVCGMWQSRQR